MFRLPSLPKPGDAATAAAQAQIIRRIEAITPRPSPDVVPTITSQGTLYKTRGEHRLVRHESGERFPNRIRKLDAAADKKWAIDNGGTPEGSDPVSLFLQAIEAAIDEEVTNQCFVVEPNQMLAEIADASPAAPEEEEENEGIWLIPAPELVTVPKDYFGDWFYIGRKFEFDADENDFKATPPDLAHPEETLVDSSDEDFDIDELESYTTDTNTDDATASIEYIASGSRTVILGRVFLPSSDGESVTGKPVIEQNVTGLVKLAWDIASTPMNPFIEASDYGVDFKIYPTLMVGDGLEVISGQSGPNASWSVFAPNWQLFHRPKSLHIADGNRAVSIRPESISGNNLETEANFWIVDEDGLRMYAGPVEAEQSLYVNLHRAPAYFDITDWTDPWTHVRTDAYGCSVKGYQWSDYLEQWAEMWSITGDGEGHASAKVSSDDGGSYAKLDSVYPNLYLYRGEPNSDNCGYSDLSNALWFGAVDDCGDWYLNFASIPSGSTAQWMTISIPSGFDPETGMPSSWHYYSVFGWEQFY